MRPRTGYGTETFSYGASTTGLGRSRAAIARTWVLAATAGLAVSGLAAAGTAAAQPVPAVRAAHHGAAHHGAAHHGAAHHGAAHHGAAGYGAPNHAADHLASTANSRQDYRRACPVTTAPGTMACMVLVRTNVAQFPATAVRPGAEPAGVGYGPASLQSAYKLPSATAGAGRTVAVVDAYDDPDAASDLATYRAAWGLPACGTGCFEKVNQNGLTSPLPPPAGGSGWATEESLDLDMVSAICPKCHILLVEASSPSVADLGTAVNRAVSMGALYVSNSYGAQESSSDPGYDSSYYDHPGVAVTASAGDGGYGVSYPAASPYVTSVGGTSLRTSLDSRGWTEQVWGSSSGGEGTGSGCSANEAKPPWQTDTGCARRTDNDVAAVADPNTGVAVYDSYDQGGWLEVGGTSASSPIIASVFALAGVPAHGSYPSAYIYAHTASLFDVTSGTDGACGGSYLCTAMAGYDGPTGWGTPDGTAAFSDGARTPNKVTVTNPGSQTGSAGTPVSLQVSGTDSAAGLTLTYSATGLPAGLSINSGTGKITGTPTTARAYRVTVTATDGTGASGSAAFAWTISQSAACAPLQLLGNPGFETGAINPWTASPNVLTHGSQAVPAHSGAWLAWLDGYGGPHTDTLAQKVAIPSNCRHATFSFWLKISTTDPPGRAYDTLRVQVLGPGTAVSTLATYSNQNSSGKYVRHSFSLSSYIGETITLKFTGTETLSGHDTSFFEDDNALSVA